MGLNPTRVTQHDCYTNEKGDTPVERLPSFRVIVGLVLLYLAIRTEIGWSPTTRMYSPLGMELSASVAVPWLLV